jgi:hypothetical protein
MALVLYAVVAATWSPYPLSALKMIGYLWCSTMLFIFFKFAWSSGWITEKVLIAVAWCAIGIAVVQTYLLDNVFGTLEGRFTTFSDPQGFAAFLVCVLALLLCAGSSRLLTRITELVIVVNIILTGSRYVFLAMIALFIAGSFLRVVCRRNAFNLRTFVIRSVAGVFPALLLLGAIAYYLPTSRIYELVSFAAARDASVEDIGTLAWRMTLYQEAFDQLTNRKPMKLLVGSGTSSSGNIIMALNSDAEETLDPNRSMHNEFLRCLYEWGVIGLILFIMFLAESVKISVRALKSQRSWQAAAFLGICPAILFSLTVENVLANSGGPAGTGYVLILACLISSVAQYSRHAKVAMTNEIENTCPMPSQ